MDASTTSKAGRLEQCRQNARNKSQSKRKAALEALATLEREGKPVTKAAVAKRAGVSTVFIRSHPDLVQAIEEADRARLATAVTGPDPVVKARDVVIDTLKRRLDDMKKALDAKEAALRLKQREIDALYGKLAASSPLSDQELRAKLEELQVRATKAEEQIADLKRTLFARRYVRMAQKARKRR